MPSLDTAANYAEIISAAAVLFAIGFAILEFRQLRRQREENASLEMMRAWQGPEYVEGIFMILQLEDHIDPQTLSEEQSLSAFHVAMTFEALGVMARRGTLPIDIINDLMGGAVCTSWRKVDRWVIRWRDMHNPRTFEWFEWLAHRLAEMPTPEDSTARVPSTQ